MKNKILILAGMLLVFASCNKDTAVDSVSISKTAGFLAVGETLQLSASVSPADADNKNISWASADPSIATVADGVVTAVADGKTSITVTSEDGGRTATCVITVNWMGKTSFRSNQVWQIGKQQWSDVVLATGCEKTTYDGGELQSAVYKADCRKNRDTKYGDWFSWEAVNQYKEQLCPDGWKVPDTNDFYTLDSIMYTEFNATLAEPLPLDSLLKKIGQGRSFGQDLGMVIYMDKWNAEPNSSYCWVYQGNLKLGYTNNFGAEVHDYSGCWSQSSKNAKDAFSFSFGTGSQHVTPKAFGDKANGYPVRCVKY